MINKDSVIEGLNRIKKRECDLEHNTRYMESIIDDAIVLINTNDLSNTKLRNIDKIRQMNTEELANFILNSAPLIANTYTCSSEGLQLWLDSPYETNKDC